MDFPKMLGELKVAIDKELENRFNMEIREARKKDAAIADALEHTKKIALAGGKRIRGALSYWAYCGVGGKEKKKIIRAAAAIEMVHLFLLIHDDIIDKGDLRHGKETLHRMLAGQKRKNISDEDAAHHGVSMAIIVGDILYAIANKMIAEAGFEDEAVIKALARLQSVVEMTVIGQAQDMAIAGRRNASEKEVLAMYENKTARYTFEGPLHVGALLAGESGRKTLQQLSRYAVPMGIAFQIQDDILGIFGDKRKTGKSVASDIEEGKQSLLVVKARRKATQKQRKTMDSILGKKNLTAKEIKVFQDILKKTGALDGARDMAAEYLQTGKKEIGKVIFLPEAKKFLVSMVEYLQGREI